jgi:hypothetical protein
MLTLLKLFRSRSVYLSETTSFVAALVVAELFYKFHSFLLETGAFLVTWLVLAAIVDTAINWLSPGADTRPSA